MAWFRIVLIVWFGVFAASAFFQAGKGEHTIVQLAFGIHQALESLGVRFGRVA